MITFISYYVADLTIIKNSNNLGWKSHYGKILTNLWFRYWKIYSEAEINFLFLEKGKKL